MIVDRVTLQTVLCDYTHVDNQAVSIINLLLKSLDEQLLEEINRTPFNQQQGREFQNAAGAQRQYRSNYQRRPRDQGFVRQRPGLSELV